MRLHTRLAESRPGLHILPIEIRILLERPTVLVNRCIWLIALFYGVMNSAFGFVSSLDQVNLRPDGFPGFSIVNVGPAHFEWQQEIVAGVNGKLLGIDIYPEVSQESFYFFVNEGEGWQDDANSFEQLVTTNVSNKPPFSGTGTDNPYYIDISSANVYLSAGDKYVFGTRGIGGNQGIHATKPASSYPTASYLSGTLFLNGQERTTIPGWDIAFRTHMLVIPEPTTYTLALTTLFLLIGLRVKL